MAILDFIQNWHHLLETLCLNAQNILWVLSAVVIIGFIASREFFTWFFKINQLNQRQKSIENQLAQLSKEVQHLKDLVTPRDTLNLTEKEPPNSQ